MFTFFNLVALDQDEE